MKFKDLNTGAILETENNFVIEQYKKYPKRYKEIKNGTETTKEKTEKK